MLCRIAARFIKLLGCFGEKFDMCVCQIYLKQCLHLECIHTLHQRYTLYNNPTKPRHLRFVGKNFLKNGDVKIINREDKIGDGGAANRIAPSRQQLSKIALPGEDTIQATHPSVQGTKRTCA